MESLHVSRIPTDDLAFLSDKLPNPRDLFPYELIHRPMLPSLAYTHGKVPQDRTAHWSVGDLNMEL